MGAPASSSLSLESCELVGPFKSSFKNKKLEQAYRKEIQPRRALWGRRCLAVFALMALALWLVALTNPANRIGPWHYAVIPGWLLFIAIPAWSLSFNLKHEVHHQIWCVVSCTGIFVAVVMNELSWVNSFDPEMNEAIKLTQSISQRDDDKYISNPICTLYITEIGWFLTIALVFTTLLMRPRLEYLCLISTTSFFSFLGGALFLQHSVTVSSIVLRVVVFSFCCSSSRSFPLLF